MNFKMLFQNHCHFTIEVCMYLHFNSTVYCCVYLERRELLIVWFIVSPSAYSTSLSLSLTSVVPTQTENEVKQLSHLCISLSNLQSSLWVPRLLSILSQLSKGLCLTASLHRPYANKSGWSLAPLHMHGKWTESYYPGCFLSRQGVGAGYPWSLCHWTGDTSESSLSPVMSLEHHEQKRSHAVRIAMYFTSYLFNINVTVYISVFFDRLSAFTISRFPLDTSNPHLTMYWFFGNVQQWISCCPVHSGQGGGGEWEERGWEMKRKKWRMVCRMAALNYKHQYNIIRCHEWSLNSCLFIIKTNRWVNVSFGMAVTLTITYNVRVMTLPLQWVWSYLPTTLWWYGFVRK